tara:strand:- start:3468 stop:5243 length:1776 start_codon:yes stop_codon:yes gene_type:complete
MFKGAALSGFVSGFGDEFAKGISERQERFDKYEDEQIATAKAKEPYLAKDRASADSAILMMNNLKRDFGLSNEDFIGLAQSNTDIESVYKSIYTAQKNYDNMPNGGKLDRATIMGTLKIPEKFEIPQGVTAEDMIYKIFTNNAYNLSQDPNNKSEEHKSNSFGKAISSALMLNPKTSAREAVNNMEIMGIRGESLLNYTPGQRGTAIEGLQASPFTLPDIEYDKDQLVRTSNRYEKDILQSFGAIDKEGNLLQEKDWADGIRTSEDSGKGITGLQKAKRAGSAFAKLETFMVAQGLDLGFGIGNKRNAVLEDIANQINTKEEVDNFINNVNNGNAVKLIVNAVRKDGNISDDTINAILGSVIKTSSITEKVLEPKDDDLEKIKKEVSLSKTFIEESDAELELGAGGSDAITKVVETNVIKKDNAAIIANLKKSDDKKEETSSSLVETTITEETKDKWKDTASKMTWKEYKDLSFTAREKLGLPNQMWMASHKDWFRGPYVGRGDGDLQVKEERIARLNREEADTSSFDDGKSFEPTKKAALAKAIGEKRTFKTDVAAISWLFEFMDNREIEQFTDIKMLEIVNELRDLKGK